MHCHLVGTISRTSIRIFILVGSGYAGLGFAIMTMVTFNAIPGIREFTSRATVAFSENSLGFCSLLTPFPRLILGPRASNPSIALWLIANLVSRLVNQAPVSFGHFIHLEYSGATGVLVQVDTVTIQPSE